MNSDKNDSQDKDVTETTIKTPIFGLTRRSWIGLTLAGGVGITFSQPLWQDEPDQIIRAILMHQLKPAHIPDKTYEDFVAVFKETEHYTGLIKAYRLFSALDWLYPSGALHRMPKLREKITTIEELVITHFTMSTNFFYDDQVQSGEKPVEFISYWRLRACNNPFATFDT